MVFATAARHDQALARRQGAIEGRRLTSLSRLWPIEKKQKEIAGRLSCAVGTRTAAIGATSPLIGSGEGPLSIAVI